MLPEGELTGPEKSKLAAALIWPAIDMQQALPSPPTGSFIGGLVSASPRAADYASLLDDTYEQFPDKAPIASLYRSLRPSAASQALLQQLQGRRDPLEERYGAVADLLEERLAPDQAAAFKELMLAVGRAALRPPADVPGAEVLQRISIALRLGPAGRHGTAPAGSADHDDVIEATRRRPSGPTPPGGRQTARRPRRQR
jgi:hypothetical protein